MKNKSLAKEVDLLDNIKDSLVREIEELESKVEELETRIEELEFENEQLKESLE